MIDTIIFDLDGVLMNSKKIHFLALNKSLKENKLSDKLRGTFKNSMVYLQKKIRNSK